MNIFISVLPTYFQLIMQKTSYWSVMIQYLLFKYYISFIIVNLQTMMNLVMKLVLDSANVKNYSCSQNMWYLMCLRLLNAFSLWLITYKVKSIKERWDSIIINYILEVRKLGYCKTCFQIVNILCFLHLFTKTHKNENTNLAERCVCLVIYLTCLDVFSAKTQIVKKSMIFVSQFCNLIWSFKFFFCFLNIN